MDGPKVSLKAHQNKHSKEHDRMSTCGKNQLYNTGMKTTNIDSSTEDTDPSRRSNYGSLEAFRNHKPTKQRAVCCRIFPEWFKEEFLQVFNLAWSMTLLTLFNYMIGPISLAFCGHLGTKTFAGITLGLMVTNVLGISVGAGLSSACGTFFSQSFGSTNKKQVGLYLIRSLLIILLFVLPCWALFLNTELLLIITGQDADNARIAGEFVLWWLPALPAVFVEEVLMQYLRCQNILAPTVIIGGIATAFNALVHYLFLYVFQFGSIGSAVSQVITFYLIAISLAIYILASGVYKQTWPGWTVEVFQEWGVFLKLATQGFVMLALQWWSWEMATLLSGLFGNVELASQSIGLQVSSIVYTVPMGIALACQIRIGQLLGAEKPIEAWRSAKIGLGLAVLCGVTLGTALAALSPAIPWLFSEDREVLDYAKNIVLMVGAYEFFDTMKGVTAGILNGCGRQGLGAAGLIVGYCLLGIPAGILLMFLTQLEIIGMYIGFTMGLMIVSLIYLPIVLRTNWISEVEKAKVRAGTNTEGIVERKRRDSTESLSDDIDETTPMVKKKQAASNVVIGGRYLSTSRVDLTKLALNESAPLSGRQLVFRRGVFITFMLSLLLAGLFVRFFVDISDTRHWLELCRFENVMDLDSNGTTLFPTCLTTTVGANTRLHS